MRRMVSRGLAATTGATAVLLLACTVLPRLLLGAADSPIGWVQDSAWPYLSVAAFVLAALMPVVMLALYECQIEETGVLGLIGFVASVIVYAAFLCFQFDMAFVWPVLAARAPELVDYDGPMFGDPGFAFVHSWILQLHSVCVLLFGLALIRARVLPRPASVLLTIGLVLSAGVLFPPLVIRVVGGVLAAPAMGWMAVHLWRRVQPEHSSA